MLHRLRSRYSGRLERGLQGWLGAAALLYILYSGPPAGCQLPAAGIHARADQGLPPAGLLSTSCCPCCRPCCCHCQHCQLPRLHCPRAWDCARRLIKQAFRVKSPPAAAAGRWWLLASTPRQRHLSKGPDGSHPHALRRAGPPLLPPTGPAAAWLPCTEGSGAPPRR